MELGGLIAKAGSILDNPGGINSSHHNYVEFILTPLPKSHLVQQQRQWWWQPEGLGHACHICPSSSKDHKHSSHSILTAFVPFGMCREYLVAGGTLLIYLGN